VPKPRPLGAISRRCSNAVGWKPHVSRSRTVNVDVSLSMHSNLGADWVVDPSVRWLFFPIHLQLSTRISISSYWRSSSSIRKSSSLVLVCSIRSVPPISSHRLLRSGPSADHILALLPPFSLDSTREPDPSVSEAVGAIIHASPRTELKGKWHFL
jgi:hypothetical protein